MPAAVSALTPRERQVLEHVRRGLSNKQISVEMSISKFTVKTHLENAYRKLGAHRRTQAVARYFG